jgi:hypothetical protein
MKKYPWHEMRLGESFFVRCIDKAMQQRVYLTLAGQASQMRRYDKTFVPWRVTGGVRVWRLPRGA